MYFGNYEVQNRWLDKCLKSPVSEHPATSKTVNGQKHCWNLNDSTFIIFIDQCEGSWNGKVTISAIKNLRIVR